MDPLDDWNTINFDKGLIFPHPTAFATGEDDSRYIAYGFQKSP